MKMIIRRRYNSQSRMHEGGSRSLEGEGHKQIKAVDGWGAQILLLVIALLAADSLLFYHLELCKEL